MRTVDFETVLAQSMQLTGLDRHNVTTQSFGQIRDFANNRIQFAWEHDAWPDLIRSTRFPVVNSGDLHYVVIPTTNTITNSEGTFKIDIGTIMQVTLEDPRIKGKVKEIGFSFDEYETLVDGVVYNTVRRIIIDIADATEVYLTYRLNCPEFVGELYDSTITYRPGQTVYWAYLADNYFAPTTGALYAGKKGNFWKCLVETNTKPNINGNSEPLGTDKWEKVKIPAMFGQYLIKGIHADWLRSEMQLDFGDRVNAEANALLDMEVNKAIVQQGIQPRMKFNQIY
jgi:hypothetical protein